LETMLAGAIISSCGEARLTFIKLNAADALLQ